jgi:hypothetical protein
MGPCFEEIWHPSIFTPGGMRGGGALWHHFTYNDIESLLWQMRLVSRQTLSHYLQETAGALSFARLSDSTVTSLRLFHRISDALIKRATTQLRLGVFTPLMESL